jgi:hypothetical protein
MVIAGHVRTIAQQSLTTPGGTTGVTEDHITATLAEVLAAEPGRFPALAAAMQSIAGSENQGLVFGIERILDGIEVLISARKG